MSNLLQRGQAMANRAGLVANGVSVTYTRGAQTLSLTAEIGRTVFASNIEGGARVQWGDRDYLITVAALTLGVPALGDRITESINSVSCVFEVVTPDTGEPAFRYSDQTETKWRLHVKRVA